MRGLEHLREFTGANGHARVRHDYTSPDGFPLGQWVSWQRQRTWGTGRPPLSPRERELLASTGLSLALRGRGRAEMAYADALAFAARVGGEHPLRALADRRWSGAVSLRQALRAALRAGLLTPDQETRLRVLGYEPDWRAAHFSHGLEALNDFIAETGFLPRKRDRSPDGFAIGEWLRGWYRASRRDSLPPERAKELERALTAD